MLIIPIYKIDIHTKFRYRQHIRDKYVRKVWVRSTVCELSSKPYDKLISPLPLRVIINVGLKGKVKIMYFYLLASLDDVLEHLPKLVTLMGLHALCVDHKFVRVFLVVEVDVAAVVTAINVTLAVAVVMSPFLCRFGRC